MQYLPHIILLLFAVVLGLLAGAEAFSNPERFSKVVDLLATVISILFGVSLAVVAVLSAPFSVSKEKVADDEERKRVSTIVSSDDNAFQSGQMILFFGYYFALILALLFKWFSQSGLVEFDSFWIKSLAGVTAMISALAIIWSVRLPVILMRISSQRKTLG